MATPEVVAEQTTTTTTERVQSPMRKLALKVAWYIDYHMRRATFQEEDRCKTWKRMVYILSLFNIQLILKRRPEKGHNGLEWFTFFVSNGTPRPMSSMRLRGDYVQHFLLLDDKYRAMLAKSFEENKSILSSISSTPLTDFHDQEKRVEAENLVENVVFE